VQGGSDNSLSKTTLQQAERKVLLGEKKLLWLNNFYIQYGCWDHSRSGTFEGCGLAETDYCSVIYSNGATSFA